MEPFELARYAIGAGVPALLAIWMFFAQRGEKQRVDALNRKREETGGVRAPDDLSAGVGRIRVHCVGDELVDLGWSIEQADHLSGAPKLTSNGFVVEDQRGRRFSVPEGAVLEVRTLGGARRNLKEAITKDGGGVVQRFSFEVDPSVKFVLKAKFPEPQAGGAFRDGPITLEGPFVVNPRTEVKRAEFGCMVYPLLAFAPFAAIYPDSVPGEIVGGVLWLAAVGLAAIGRMITNDHLRSSAEPQETEE